MASNNSVPMGDLNRAIANTSFIEPGGHVGKGASGAAVQNLLLMLGVPPLETAHA